MEIVRYDKRRKHRRMRPKKPTYIQFRLDLFDEYISGVLLNISPSGIGFASDTYLPEALKQNDQIEIKIKSGRYIAEVRHVSDKICGCRLLKKL